MAKRFAFGGGHVMLGADGGPVAFAHPRDPGRSYLLDAASQGWHGPDHRWGSGFVITPEGSGRWQAAADVAWRPGGVTTRHRPRPGLELVLDGRVTAEHFVETYTWTNTSARPVQVTGLAVSVPVRDVYDGAASALARSCHAHVFTAGAWSWILAEPMSGTPPLLGVIVREGSCGRTRSSPATATPPPTAGATCWCMPPITPATRTPSAGSRFWSWRPARATRCPGRWAGTTAAKPSCRLPTLRRRCRC
ncbi:hypothetical protein ACFQ0B_46570 [Nonomuraea thailandensis]